MLESEPRSSEDNLSVAQMTKLQGVSGRPNGVFVEYEGKKYIINVLPSSDKSYLFCCLHHDIGRTGGLPEFFASFSYDPKIGKITRTSGGAQDLEYIRVFIDGFKIAQF